MKKIAIVLPALALLAGPALAHHSGAMFDRKKEAVLNGVIKEFGWNNPHSWIRIMVPDATGALKEWTVEMGPPSFLARAGWTKNTLKPGDKVELKVYPLYSGAAGGAFKAVTLADGKVLSERQTADPATAQ
jgi:hypothetical protein